MVEEIIIFIILGLYFFLMIVVLTGVSLYKNTINSPKKTINEDSYFSVIISVRNESVRIENLLKSILNQKYDKSKVEWLFVDDFSNDNTVDIIRKILNEEVNYKILQAEGKGKKQAQKTGGENARFDKLIFLDADVVLPNNYLQHVAHQFNNCDLLIMPVSFKYENNTVAKWAYYEQLILNALNVGFGYFFKPLFANGANMAVKKSVYLDTVTIRKDWDLASGDDVFLLQACTQLHKKIKVAYQPEVLVQTIPPQSWKELLYQKIRWAAKMKRYPLDLSFITGLIISLFNLLYIILPILSVFQIKYVEYFAIIFLIKMMIDKMLLFLVVKLLKTEYNKPESFIISVFYPYYQWIILALSMINKPVEWKGRKVI